MSQPHERRFTQATDNLWQRVFRRTKVYSIDTWAWCHFVTSQRWEFDSRGLVSGVVLVVESEIALAFLTDLAEVLEQSLSDVCRQYTTTVKLEPASELAD